MKSWGGLSAIFFGTFLVVSCHPQRSFRNDTQSGMDSPSEFDSQLTPGMGAKNEAMTLANRAEVNTQPRKRVMVLNFWNNTPIQDPDLGSFVADELRRGLFLSNKLMLMSDGNNPLNTEAFLDGEHLRVAQLIREGRRVGVSVLVVGRLTKIVFRQNGDEIGFLAHKQSLAAADVEIKVFDVQGGREIVASTQSGEVIKEGTPLFNGSEMKRPAYRSELIRMALRDAASKFVGDIVRSVDKLIWQGHIAKLAGRKIYVNAGKASGLMVGDILRVLNPGEEIYDPQTGALLGTSRGALKGTLEVVDFMGMDAALAEVHTGGSFREGDIVQLY